MQRKITSENNRGDVKTYILEMAILCLEAFKQAAQIIHLTGRCGQSALETATPSSLGYDGGAHFHCCARQGS